MRFLSFLCLRVVFCREGRVGVEEFKGGRTQVMWVGGSELGVVHYKTAFFLGQFG